jgi:hypothetical protein
VPPESGCLVLAAVETTLLEDRHDVVHELLEPVGQGVAHEVEPVSGTRGEPLLEGVGDLLGRTGDLPVADLTLGDQFPHGPVPVGLQ